MKKYISAPLITTAFITIALISTHATHSMLAKRTALSTATRAALAQRPQATTVRAIAYKPGKHSVIIESISKPIPDTTELQQPKTAASNAHETVSAHNKYPHTTNTHHKPTHNTNTSSQYRSAHDTNNQLKLVAIFSLPAAASLFNLLYMFGH